jgi:hypothetical protein
MFCEALKLSNKNVENHKQQSSTQRNAQKEKKSVGLVK